MAASSFPSLPAFLTQSKAELHAKFVDLEWQQRNRLLQGSHSTDPHSQFSRLSGDAIALRNRYLNVEPFANNRIKLKVSGDGESDYINASPIVLGKRRYIATQGPKDTGVQHFWRMLDAEVDSPAVVVMLTQTHEAGREKCFQYYPLSAEESPLVLHADASEGAQGAWSGEVELLSVRQDERCRCEVRRMRLRSRISGQAGTREKEIHHLLFSGWPDFLIPEGEDRTALLSLIGLSAKLNAPAAAPGAVYPSRISNGHPHPAAADHSNPRIVHCSAGVGRSGTFIALDYLLAALRAGELDAVLTGRDPIAETVDLLRQQRMMMVQGESQFNFLYEVVREEMANRISERERVR